MKTRIWLGAMGWQEKDWVGPFYPDNTSSKSMLAHYGRVLHSVEVDSTFYGRPRATTVEEWRAAVPDDFRFALKVPSHVTHKLRFREADEIFRFFVERVRGLGPKLGAILLQCPPNFAPNAANRERLFTFLETQLPSDVRVTVELRDRGWYDDALFALAKEKRFAVAATESTYSDMAFAEAVLERQRGGADFAYLRWMGEEEFEHYDRVQADRSEMLAAWASIIARLRGSVSDIFGYVSDDYAGHAPATVRELLTRLGEEPPPEITTPRLF